MKKNTLIFTAFPLFFIFGCTAVTHFDSVQPAAVDLHSGYKKALLINRTGSDKTYQLTNAVEGVLSGEWYKRDAKLPFYCLEGLSFALSGSTRKYVTEIIKDSVYKGTGTEIFPEALTPSFVQDLCSKHNADFLIALEAFDVDIVSRELGAPAPISVIGIAAAAPITGPTFSLKSVVKTGWRIYPARDSTIIDRYLNKTSVDFASLDIPDHAVILHLPAAREAINKNCRLSGSDYTSRIIPFMITLHRHYFVGGSSAMRKAARYTYINKWDQAFDIWSKNMDYPKRIGWKSMYNMAVNYEMTGNLDEAIKMAEGAYIKYNKRHAMFYANDLKERKNMNNKASEQLGQNK